MGRISPKNPNSSGLFIVFEGPHASGKSYFAKTLEKKMSSLKIRCEYTKEPYTTSLKPTIRKLSKRDSQDPIALFFLIQADRMLHLQKVNALQSAGVSVISDRYVQSTEVYQRIQKVPIKIIREAIRFAKEPDLIFYVDTPFKVRLDRIRKLGRMNQDLFYEYKQLALEDRYYAEIKRKLSRCSNSTIIDGQTKHDLDKISRIVMKRLSESNHL